MSEQFFEWLSGRVKENIKTKMKQIIYLDENDLKEIVAKHFNANVSNVHIRISNETRGFGSMEEAVNTATCEIEINT